jgi:UDP-N-acetylmuramoyl-L-alanyl-D-glutamate--2,6-diaminopimelate ligase
VEVAVVGVDGSFGRSLAAELRERGSSAFTYGRRRDARYRLERWRCEGRRAEVSAIVDGEAVVLRTRLPGEHNALNALATLALADALEVARPDTLAALEEAAAPPGRLEFVDEGQPFDVIVDFAHNPDGIRESLRFGRSQLAGRRGGSLRAVACALRILTPRQRRAMGRAAARGCDQLILSVDRVAEDEPLHELPSGLVEGAREAGGCEVVADRREAIATTIARARPGDVVMVLGRGARAVGLDAEGRRIELDDREEARRALRGRD